MLLRIHNYTTISQYANCQAPVRVLSKARFEVDGGYFKRISIGSGLEGNGVNVKLASDLEITEYLCNTAAESIH